MIASNSRLYKYEVLWNYHEQVKYTEHTTLFLQVMVTSNLAPTTQISAANASNKSKYTINR
jgi:hypothetical protein